MDHLAQMENILSVGTTTTSAPPSELRIKSTESKKQKSQLPDTTRCILQTTRVGGSTPVRSRRTLGLRFATKKIFGARTNFRENKLPKITTLYFALIFSGNTSPSMRAVLW
jgi:hypothetical protein